MNQNEIEGYGIQRYPDDVNLVKVCTVLRVGEQQKQIAKMYKVRYTPGGRPFVSPDYHRIYIDELFAD